MPSIRARAPPSYTEDGAPGNSTDKVEAHTKRETNAYTDTNFEGESGDCARCGASAERADERGRRYARNSGGRPPPLPVTAPPPLVGEDATDTAYPYGQNNEQLPERMQEALRRLVFQFSTESELSRRQEIRRIKQAHQFWRGLQYLWWNEGDQNWHLPTEQRIGGAASVEEMPRYEFVTNIYQAFGLSLVSVLSLQDDAARAIFPLVRAGGRGRGRREGRDGSCGAGRAEQSHREFNRRGSV